MQKNLSKSDVQMVKNAGFTSLGSIRFCWQVIHGFSGSAKQFPENVPYSCAACYLVKEYGLKTCQMILSRFNASEYVAGTLR